MSDLESKRIKAVEALERLTAYFENGEWVLPPLSILPHEYSPMLKRGRANVQRQIAEFGSTAEALKARRLKTPQWQAFEAAHRRLMATPAEEAVTATFQAWRQKAGWQ